MDILLAKILGLYYFFVGFSFVLNPARIKKMYQKIMENESLLFLSGFIALLVGACIISMHNQWKLDWSLIITLIGWLSLLKGILLIVYPNIHALFSFMKNWQNWFYQILGAFLMILGLFLTYQGQW